MNIQWNTDKTISIDPPKRPKKMTATKFAAVLGMNRWSTPFQQWCEITRTYNQPFEDTIYTKAGKAIEPKQIQYMRDQYAMDDLLDPTDVYGPDYFKKTWGNFFDHPILGGMWDAITKDEDGTVTSVLEFKTTKRAEDWAEDIPEYYALQAALYAWLLGCDDVIMVATFLKDADYDDPESFEVNADNTTTFEFKVSERYPDFEEKYVKVAIAWWDYHVKNGISPEYDERADADYLAELRNTSLNPETDVDRLLAEYEELTDYIETFMTAVAEKSKRRDAIKAQLKQFATENIGDGDTATFSRGRVTCKLTKTSRTVVDEKRLKADGLFDQYSKVSESSRFNVTVSKK